ncbi:unnamed protein product [Gongylonema pulchrum]|uniref:Ubiquitin-protein ligase E3A n=1 Tax=Gongylonema pulchrum TaxID=637853 RepID=A0A183E355_9BILA|nr:unnamed protein product [Gongylonema pulchrum]
MPRRRLTEAEREASRERIRQLDAERKRRRRLPQSGLEQDHDGHTQSEHGQVMQKTNPEPAVGRDSEQPSTSGYGNQSSSGKNKENYDSNTTSSTCTAVVINI